MSEFDDISWLGENQLLKRKKGSKATCVAIAINLKFLCMVSLPVYGPDGRLAPKGVAAQILNIKARDC